MIRIGIAGCGNLGRAFAKVLEYNKDMELVAMFTRRDPSKLSEKLGTNNIYSMDEILKWEDKIDVLLLGGGSASDLPVQSPELSKHFNIVDSFDTHKDIPSHFERVCESSKETGHLSLISCGWDPGLFSLNRLMMEAILPKGETFTFWGKGISQGHSDAIRRIEGVKNAKQYTVPLEDALLRVKNGEGKGLKAESMHKRVCYVVAEENADRDRIKDEIVNMPKYFKGYDTEVNFISEEELDKNHSGLPHGGFVVRHGLTNENTELMEFKLSLDSNPEFTASVICAYARAIYRMFNEGIRGALTIFDIAPKYIIDKDDKELRSTML